MGKNPSRFKDDSRPVERVSWDDIQIFLRKLNQKLGLSGRYAYRLPSEAEWEYAARAETTTKYSWGNHIGRNNANCDGCGSQWDDKKLPRLGHLNPTHLVSMICMAMFGNGCKIVGMIAIKTP